MERSHEYKQEKYSPLVADLSRSYRTKYYPVEVSVRGQVTKKNKARFKLMIYGCCIDPRKNFKSLIANCSKLLLLSSFSIFSARKEPTWTSPGLLTVRWVLFLCFLVLFCFYLIQSDPIRFTHLTLSLGRFVNSFNYSLLLFMVFIFVGAWCWPVSVLLSHWPYANRYSVSLALTVAVYFNWNIHATTNHKNYKNHKN